MEIRHLEAFVQTVNCNSFSKAAKLMQLSQPTISSHINTLEKEMGTKLLVRTTKNMELTAKGRRFYEQVSEFLKMRDSIQQEFQDQHNNEIYIDASVSSVQWFLPHMIKKFGAGSQQVKFQIRKSSEDEVLYNVKTGLADLGLTDSYVEDEVCTTSLLYEYSMVLALPADHYYQALLDCGASLEEVLKEPIILQEKKHDKGADLNILLDKLGLEKKALNVAASLQDCAGVLQYVASGLGIALTHEWAAAQMAKDGEILILPIPKELVSKKIYIIRLKDCENELIEQFLNINEKDITG